MDEIESIEEVKPERLRSSFFKPASDYPPPYIHPLTRLFIYLAIILVTGNHIMGWTGFQELLYKAGTFEDLCDVSTMEFTSIRSTLFIDCPARKAAINELYTIAFSTNIICCIFSGVILDFLGQKATFIFGTLTNFMCWILLGIFVKNGFVLKFIMFIIGFSAESLYLPLTTVSLYFEGHKSLILSIMASFRSLSFFMTSVLSYIYHSPKFKSEYFFLLTAGFGTFAFLGSFMVGIAIIPWKFFDESHKQKDLEEVSVPKNRTDFSLPTISECFTMSKEACIHPLMFQVVLFTIPASLNIASVAFINMAQRELLVTSQGDSAINFFRYTQFLTFIPGILMGPIVNKIGSSMSMIILLIFVLLSYISFGIDSYSGKVVGCLTYLVGGCLFLSIIYFYVYDFCPPERIGCVIGTILIFCGIAILVNIPIYKMSLKLKEKGQFSRVCYLLEAYILVSILIMVILIIIQRQRRRLNGKNTGESNSSSCNSNQTSDIFKP